MSVDKYSNAHTIEVLHHSGDLTLSTTNSGGNISVLSGGSAFVNAISLYELRAFNIDLEAFGNVNIKSNEGMTLESSGSTGIMIQSIGPGNGHIHVQAADALNLYGETSMDITAGGGITVTATTGDLKLWTGNDVQLVANDGRMDIHGEDAMDITSKHRILINSQNQDIIAKQQVYIQAEQDPYLGTGSPVPGLEHWGQIVLEPHENNHVLVEGDMVVTGKISGTADTQTLKLSSEDGNNFIIVNNDSIWINQNNNNSLSIADQSYMFSTGGDFLTASVDDGVFQVFGWGETTGWSHPVVFVNLDTNDQADVLKLMIGTTVANQGILGGNKFIRFSCGSGTTTDRSAGTELGAISANGLGGVQFTHSFTGSHACIMETADENKPGLIVSSTGKIWMKKESISQATPKVALASTHKDKNVYGVISTINPEDYAGYVDANGKSNTEDCMEINSVGDGRIWVTNILGEVLLGDYITSSDIAGFGAKQDDDILRSYTVAKCTESIDWESITDVVEADGSSYKRYLSACTYHCG